MVKISKVLFIGLGGAGQRHLRILKKLLPIQTSFFAFRYTAKTPFLLPDFTVDENNSINDNYQLHIFDNIESAFDEKPELTVISTPTSCHREPMMMAMHSGSGVIVEKPWAEDLTGFSTFREGMLRKQLPFLISFQRRFHPLIASAHHLIKSGKIGRPMAASFTVFSDVTTWHGYEDWRTLYAVRKELGGGVLLTEIHEIDLSYWFFGLPDAVFCTGGNRSSEKLNVEDTVQITLLYKLFSVQITLCFMHKSKMRRFYIAGTEGAISWNEEDNKLNISSLKETTEEFTASTFTNDSMFISQAEQFVSSWNMKCSEESLLSAGSSLVIVDAARRSMISGKVEPVDKSILSI